MATALRFLCRGVTTTLLKSHAPVLVAPTVRYEHHHINFAKLTIDKLDESQLTDYEISRDPKEWQFVERVLPPLTVPQPKQFDGPSPAGWIPPNENAMNLPYFVKRSKNHMQPVYMKIDKRRTGKTTIVRHIQGDIWQFERELREYLTKYDKKLYKKIASRVNELYGFVEYKGDHVNRAKQWMTMKGF